MSLDTDQVEPMLGKKPEAVFWKCPYPGCDFQVTVAEEVWSPDNQREWDHVESVHRPLRKPASMHEGTAD